MRRAAGAQRGGPAASRTPPKYTAAGRLPVPPAATIRINPAVLRWVMDNEGWDADELARDGPGRIADTQVGLGRVGH